VSTWHVADDDLRNYAAGAASVAAAASVETHVVRCAVCAAALTPAVDPGRLDAVWTEVADRLDRPRQGLLERLLIRAGVPADDARLLAATPGLRRGWFGALALAVALGLLATLIDGSGDATFVLLLAPVLPVAGVAAAFGRHADPAYDITVATPFSNLRLLLLRAVTVLATSVAVIGSLALALPDAAATAAWLLPAFGLTLATLALATWWDVAVAAGLVGGTWAVLVCELARRRDISDLSDGSSQLGTLALAFVAAAVLARRHRFFDQEGTR
jgi:hypothetical protein